VPAGYATSVVVATRAAASSPGRPRSSSLRSSGFFRRSDMDAIAERRIRRSKRTCGKSIAPQRFRRRLAAWEAGSVPSKNLRRSFILRDYSEGRFGRLMLCLLAFRNRAVDWDDTDRRIAFDGDKLVPGFECRFPAQVLERLCRRGAIEM